MAPGRAGWLAETVEPAYCCTAMPARDPGLQGVRLGRVDHLHGARMRGRCSPVSGPISVRSDRGSLGQLRTHAVQQIPLLFYHLVGSGEECLADGEADRLGGFQIDHQLELGRILNRQIAHLGAAQDAIDIGKRIGERYRRNSIRRTSVLRWRTRYLGTLLEACIGPPAGNPFREWPRAA